MSKKILLIIVLAGLISTAAFAQEILTAPEVSVVTLETVSAPVKERIIKRLGRFSYETGGSIGIFAGATIVNSEARFALPLIYGPVTASLRLAGGYVQSEDAAARYIPLQVDAILNFPPGIFTGVNNYIGGGVNYIVLMTGRTGGAVGAEVFYGVESEGFAGRLFGELGCGLLNGGSGPSQSGITVLCGYRS